MVGERRFHLDKILHDVRLASQISFSKSNGFWHGLAFLCYPTVYDVKIVLEEIVLFPTCCWKSPDAESQLTTPFEELHFVQLLMLSLSLHTLYCAQLEQQRKSYQHTSCR